MKNLDNIKLVLMRKMKKSRVISCKNDYSKRIGLVKF